MDFDAIVPVLLAVLAAASWGFSAVLVRIGLRDASTSAGTLISLVAGCVYMGALVVVLQFGQLRNVSLRGVLLFGLIGVLNFPVGRFFNYMGMNRLGVGRSTPLLASAPLFAVLIAVIFTGEQVRLATAAGGALILGGLYVTIFARAR